MTASFLAPSPTFHHSIPTSTPNILLSNFNGPVPIPKVLNVLPLPPRSGPSHPLRVPRPSPLHFRWHSSNVPGLGKQPQAPSAAVPAALAAAGPGVRSEPRPAPAPAPRPPPSGGSVKPGGEGGGGGSPTRAGAGGGGGGPAGSELAANTLPMVTCKGKGQRAEVRAHTLLDQTPANPRSAQGPGSHLRHRLLPAWAPHPPRAPRATEPAAATATAGAPPHVTHWFSMLWGPPTSFRA